MFLPKDFDKTQASNYTKLEEGANRIRILKEPITGYVYWLDKNGNVVPKNNMAGDGGKPMRYRTWDEVPMEARGVIRGFAAMIIWNYQLEKIQILEVKQVGIMNSLEALSNSRSWGDITTFDIVITRTKTGPETRDVEYSVMPEPKEDLSKQVLEAYDKVVINLNALYDGEDPFGESLSSEDLKDLDEEIAQGKE